MKILSSRPRLSIIIADVRAENSEDSAIPARSREVVEILDFTRDAKNTSITHKSPPAKAKAAIPPRPYKDRPAPAPMVIATAAPKPAPELTPSIWLSAIGFLKTP